MASPGGGVRGVSRGGACMGVVALLSLGAGGAFAPVDGLNFDLVAVRVLTYDRSVWLPLVPGFPGCVLCVEGTGLTLGPAIGMEGAPPEPLPPGQYVFLGRVEGASCMAVQASPVRLEPASGVWSVPVLVWRDHAQVGPGLPVLEDHTGRSGPLLLATECHGPVVESRDLLLLPMGNLALPVTARASVTAGAQVATDVDAYPPWDGRLL